MESLIALMSLRNEMFIFTSAPYVLDIHTVPKCTFAHFGANRDIYSINVILLILYLFDYYSIFASAVVNPNGVLEWKPIVIDYGHFKNQD